MYKDNHILKEVIILNVSFHGFLVLPVYYRKLEQINNFQTKKYKLIIKANAVSLYFAWRNLNLNHYNLKIK